MISAAPSGGTGLLAVFCDLAPEWHREFREWLRDDMIPARLQIGFRQAASYDLIADAPGSAGHPETFVTVYETASIGDLYGAPYQALRANRDERDTAFHARFIRPRRYTLAWVGPQLARTSGAFAPVASFDSFDLAHERVQDFNTWYVTEHLPRLAAIPEVHSVRRYLAMEGAPRHVVVTELGRSDALRSAAFANARRALAAMLEPSTAAISGDYVLALGKTGTEN
jgi:hypothetical protein